MTNTALISALQAGPGSRELSRPVLERFEEKFTQGDPSECWIWHAGKFSNGYGSFRLARRTKQAHRLSWEFYRGPIPAGIHVLHKCDVPSCVNPNHLFLGTHQDNMDDREAKGRGNHAKGERSSNAKLTNNQAKEIFHSQGTHKELGLRYGVGKTAVSKIKRKVSWKHIHQEAEHD